jgi:DNA-binding MarR family transcriptional regulator
MEEGRLLTELVVTTFRLNRSLLDVAEGLAAEGEITAAWWQVLGGILDQPRTVPEIGRRMGMTRQAVQRVADLLVHRGLAEYRPNPNHRRANLLACTEAGYWAIRRIAIAQHPWANRIGAEVGTVGLRRTLTTMQRILSALEADDRVQHEEESAAAFVRRKPTGSRTDAGSMRHAGARSK